MSDPMSSCIICCHDSQFYCYGPCDHPVCLECGVRLRMICGWIACSICREEMEMIVVIEKRASSQSWPAFDCILAEFNVHGNGFHKLGLAFENKRGLVATRDILTHVCTVCESRPEFVRFDQLRRHMRSTHQLHYCDLCVNNLELFSWERKCYRRDQLERHQREGDFGDHSYHAHPLCGFCKVLVFDDDQLYKHMRMEHFSCDFCGGEGKNVFFSDLAELKEHFKAEHILCEIDNCRHEPFGVSFSNQEDFHAHQMQEHSLRKNKRCESWYQSDFPALLRANGPVASGTKTNVFAHSSSPSFASQLQEPVPIQSPRTKPASKMPNDPTAMKAPGNLTSAKPKRSFVLIDDDEEFPSVSAEMAAAAKRSGSQTPIQMRQPASTSSLVLSDIKADLNQLVDKIKKTYELAMKQSNMATPLPPLVSSVKAKLLRIAQEKQNLPEAPKAPPSQKNVSSQSNCRPKQDGAIRDSARFKKPLSTPMPANASSAAPRPNQYVKPRDFDLRNRALLDQLKERMGQDADRIETFKRRSLEYQRGSIDASTFCVWMQVLLDDDSTYASLFSELLCLLPDIDCQQRLHDAILQTGIRLCEDAMKKCGKCGPVFMAQRPSGDMNAFRELFRKSKYVVVLTGAGISAESGVPTFRGAGGLWRTYQATDLASPHAFRRNPSLVWEFYHYRRELVLTKKPNAAHYAIAEAEKRLEEEKRKLVVVTQNVDELHRTAGSKNVVELHGSLFRTRCTACNTVEENRKSPICEGLRGKGLPDPQTMESDIPIEKLPRCVSCGGLLRPDIIWFGENLDPEVVSAAEMHLRNCDLCLIVGTSSIVYPAAMFAPQLAREGKPVAEFNVEETPATGEFKFHFKGLAGQTLPEALKP